MRFVPDHEGVCEVCSRYGSDVLHPYDLWWAWSFSTDAELRFQCVEAALDKHRQHPGLLTLHRRPSAFADLRVRKLEACAAYGKLGSESKLTADRMPTANTLGAFPGGRRERLRGDEPVSYDIASAYPFELERLEPLEALAALVKPEGER
jgi:hypothetical protein